MPGSVVTEEAMAALYGTGHNPVTGEQGATVDTAHTVITPAMNRQSLYVAMTRGRGANHAHIATNDSAGKHLGSLGAGLSFARAGVEAAVGVDRDDVPAIAVADVPASGDGEVSVVAAGAGEPPRPGSI